MQKFLVLCSVLSIFLLSRCSSSDPTEETAIAPEFTVTGPVRSSFTGSHTGISMSAQVTFLGSEKIIAYGFVYATHNSPDIDNASIIQYDFELNESRDFSARLDEQVAPKTLYYVRAFLKTEKGKIHYSSNTAEFVSLAGTWKRLADFPGPHRIKAMTFGVGNKGYLVGGVSFENISYTDVWEYDMATDTWSEKNGFPQDAITSEHGAAFVIDEIAYVVSSSGLWRYNQSADEWIRLGNGINRKCIMAFVINGKAYVGDGYAGFLLEYDPVLNTWTERRQYPGEASNQLYGMTDGNKGYAGFGRGPDFGGKEGEYENEFYEYDPINNQWTEKESFYTNTFGIYCIKAMSCFSIGDKTYIGLGRSTSTDVDVAEFYEFNAQSGWTEVNSLTGSQRSNAVAFSIGSKGFVGAGLKYYYQGQVDKLKDFWQFEP